MIYIIKKEIINDAEYDEEIIAAVVESPVKLNLKVLFEGFKQLNKTEGWRWIAKKMNAAGYAGKTKHECFASYLVKHYGCYYIESHEVVL